jgi:hypothetical protein
MNTTQTKEAAETTTFLTEWKPFNEVENMVKSKILSHFLRNAYQFQATNDPNSTKPFKVYTFSQIDNVLGLAYTSSGDYAGLWCCNAGYLLNFKNCLYA